MPKLIDNLELILPDFDLWYADNHGGNENIYDDVITFEHLSTLPKRKFIDFFVEFRKSGGLVQTGGGRHLNEFEDSIRSNFENFKNYILLPFSETFDLKEWLLNRKNFLQWGIGISTIYLNRIDKLRYAILNQKTKKALNKLDIPLNISIHSYQAYELVSKIEKEIINAYNNTITNFYKVDALCHYICSVLPEDRYKKLRKKCVKLSKNEFIDYLNQDILSKEINLDTTFSNNINIISHIKRINKEKNEYVTYKGRKYKRQHYQLELIKKLRKYTCQFCKKQIIKADGTYYIEACHINPKCEGGSDYLNNILILCPNCHKEFDLGIREELSHTNKIYKVKVNGMEYKIIFEDDSS